MVTGTSALAFIYAGSRVNQTGKQARDRASLGQPFAWLNRAWSDRHFAEPCHPKRAGLGSLNMSGNSPMAVQGVLACAAWIIMQSVSSAAVDLRTIDRT